VLDPLLVCPKLSPVRDEGSTKQIKRSQALAVFFLIFLEITELVLLGL